MRVPSVPIVVAETRKLAQEGSYRFFGAALVDAAGQGESTARLIALPGGGPVPPDDGAGAGVGAGHRRRGADRGRLRPEVWEAYRRDRTRLTATCVFGRGGQPASRPSAPVAGRRGRRDPCGLGVVHVERGAF